MIHILSPAKSLDFENQVHLSDYSIPAFKEESQKLIKKLQSLSKKKVKSLMSLSDNLTELNVNRYNQWEGKESLGEESRQAIFAFKGDVYLGLEAETLSESDLQYAQDHLIILSGLYGALKPLDVIEPYRLEMGTQLKVGRKKNLYDFWDNQITNKINDQLAKQSNKVIVNLASNEYFKAVKPKLIDADIITPQFKDEKNGKYKMISFFAKKARGMMSKYIIENKIESPEELEGFDYGGYRFNRELSKKLSPVFTRDENQRS